MAEGVAHPTRSAQSMDAALSLRRVSLSYLWPSAAVGLALLALALRLYHIGSESIWLDEGYTLLFSRLPLDRLFTVGGAHEHPPLYYLIVHFLLDIRNSPVVPRLVSAVAGSLSVLVLYALGAQLVGRLAALFAAMLLALAPFHVWYAQDGRAYELASLFVLLSYLFVFRALDLRTSASEHPTGNPEREPSLYVAPRPRTPPDRRSLWVAYAVCTALALYSEYTTTFVLLPQALLLLRARRSGLSRSLLLAWGGTALAFAPWMATLALDAASIAGNYWIPAPTFGAVSNTVLEFLGFGTPCTSPPCTGSEAAFPILSGHETAVASICMLAAWGLLLLAVARRNLTLSVLALWLVLPFALVLLIAVKRSLYLDRVFLDATFPLYLLLGAAVARLTRRSLLAPLGAALLALLVVGAQANVRLVYANPTKTDWRSAARDLGAAYRPGQAVVFSPGVLQSVVAAYLPSGWHATEERPLWYHSYLDVPGWQSRFARLVKADLTDRDVEPGYRYSHLDNDLRDRELADIVHLRDIWLVTEDYAGFDDTRLWFLSHGFHLLLSEIYFDDSRIELWSRRLPSQVGPAVVPDDGFGAGWFRHGSVVTASGVARENGRSTMARRFRVKAGGLYVVNVDYRGFPPASPSVSVRVYDHNGHPLGTMVDRFGNRLQSFPRTEWYNMPVNGVWLSEPFGFIAPPGAVRARLTVQNAWGETDWRKIAVYGER